MGADWLELGRREDELGAGRSQTSERMSKDKVAVKAQGEKRSGRGAVRQGRGFHCFSLADY